MPDLYGTVALLLGISAFGFNLFCTPIFQALLRFYPECASVDRVGPLRHTTLSLLLRTTSLLTALFLVAVIAISLATDRIWWDGVMLAAIVGAEAYRTFESTVLAAARRQRPLALWQASEAWARPVFAIVIIWLWGPSSTAVLAGYAIGTVVIAMVFKGLLDDTHPTDEPNREQDEGLAREITGYAWPLVPLAFVAWLHAVSDRYLVGMFLDLTSVGVYSATFALAARPITMVNAVLMGAIQPAYYQAVAESQTEQSYRYFFLWCALATTMSLALIALLFLFRAELITLLLAKQYQAGADLLAILALGSMLLSLSQILNAASLAYKKPVFVLISETTSAIATVAVGLPLIWKLGLIGAALMVPGRYMIQLLSAGHLAALARRQYGSSAHPSP
jgi:O-antigen/teichoic acid export membrane protein